MMKAAKPCGGKERCGHSSKVACALSSICSNQIYGISPTHFSPFNLLRVYAKKRLWPDLRLKTPPKCVFLRVFINKTGRLLTLPYGGLDHSSLWIEAITLYGPFTIAFDIKNPRLLALYKPRRGVFLLEALSRQYPSIFVNGWELYPILPASEGFRMCALEAVREVSTPAYQHIRSNNYSRSPSPRAAANRQ